MDNSMLLLLVTFVSTAAGYPHGAPYSTCISQYPEHGEHLPQTSPSPYVLQVSHTTYGPGGNITVTIAGPGFIGFSLTARRVKGNTEEILGTFVDFPSTHSQAYNCLGGHKNFMTHTSDSTKTNTTFTWTLGTFSAGDVVFWATVLKTEDTFWTSVSSPNITDSSNAPVLGNLQQVQNVFPEMNLGKDCGHTKGCFMNPKTCSGNDCTSAISYQLDGDVIHFEMMGVAEGYVSVGFSDDELMGDDDVVACTAEGSTVSVKHGFNVGYQYLPQYSDQLTNKATAKKDGKIYCRFTRPMSLPTFKVEEDYDQAGAPQELVVNLTVGKMLMLATGKTFAGGDVLVQHEENPVITMEKVDFSRFKVERGSSMSVLTQIHGVLMILAWMLLVSFATVEGRYFRDGLGARMVGGMKLWFQMHRIVTVCAAGLSAAGFIVIFVKVKGMSKTGQAHAIVGIVVMAATCGQVFLGLIRPGPKAGWRPIFNWLHRLLGQSTHILAAADLILAYRIPILPKDMRRFGTTVVAVWICLQVVWEVTLEINKYLESRTPKVEANPDPDQMKVEEKVVKKGPNTRLQLIFFDLFILTIVSCTIAAICPLFLY